MKLIIDIPDEAYNVLLTEQVLPPHIDVEWLLIHGTPLDDVIGMIDKAYNDLDGYDPYALGTFANMVSDILDNIGKAESEGY